VSGVEEERKAERKKAEAEEEDAESDVKLPPLDEGEFLEKLEWTSERKETQPPPRYTEASLVKALEENGVGRPSTYATTISTILERRYVEKDKRALKPTPMGFQVNDFLVQHLPSLFDIQFTARMEEELDSIEEGKMSWVKMLESFYGSFKEWVQKAKGPSAEIEKVKGVLGLLDEVREWAAPTKRGRRTYSDAEYVKSVREQLAAGDKPVSERQLDALINLAVRYRDQIPDFFARAAALGIEAAVSDRVRAAEHPDDVTREKIEALANVPFEPPREVRKRIYDDRVFFNSLREQVESGRRLTPSQTQHLDRMLQKYAGHIPDFEQRSERWGLTIPAAADPHIGALIELARSISQWREPVARGKKVWNDKDFADSLIRQFDSKKTLTPRQVSALKKLVSRYADRIPDYAARASAAGLSPRNASAELPADA
jgi:hypothetical protein